MGQEVTATIVGTITDQSGAAVSGASVKAISVDRGTSYSAVSTMPVSIASHSCRQEVTLSRSEKWICHRLSRGICPGRQPDCPHRPGAQGWQVTETLEVTGAPPVLETDSTQVNTVINAATNDNLPLASRNYVQLTLLAPGAVSTDPAALITATIRRLWRPSAH